MKVRKYALTLLAVASLSACDREATGQVAAVVNGEEITLPELNAEIAGAQIPEGADQEAVRQAALQRIVERRLLAQVAREEGIESSQDYLIRERQLKDSLLVQLLGQRVQGAIEIPDQQRVDQYIEDNPAVFANRKIFTIDRIQFSRPSDISSLSALESAHSMEAVADRLRQLGIEFRRDEAQMDSAALGQQRLQQIQSLPAGEPFVIPENGVVTVGVITDESEASISEDEARPIAVQALRNQELRSSLQQRLEQARLQAEIEYQEGLAPPSEEDQAGSTPAP